MTLSRFNVFQLCVIFWLLVAIGVAHADSQGSATGGTAGTQSTGAGCIQQTPGLSSGQQATLSCDSNGNLKVNVQSGGGGGGGAVYGPTATGTASANPPVQIGGTTTGAAGANVQGAAVKPASTLPASTDSAVVVTQRDGLPSGTNTLGTVNLGTLNGAATVANQASPFTASVTNPTSTLSLTSSTTAYAAGNLIANNATAGSITVPNFTLPNSAGGFVAGRILLTVNDSGGGWSGATVQLDLFTAAAPTFTNGDHAAFAVATGSANHRAQYTCTFYTAQGDGTWAECIPSFGTYVLVKLASGTALYWTLQSLNGTGALQASKTITATLEEVN